MQLNDNFPKVKGELAIYQHIGGEMIHGKIVGGKIVREIKDHNLIVDTASILMACRMAPGAIVGGDEASFEGNYLDFGLRHIALGLGVLQDPTQPYDPMTNHVDYDQWDVMNPPEPTLEENKLVGEFYRKRFTSWHFQDAAGEETDTPTNILLIDTTFYENEGNGPISEVGLFGGASLEHNDGEGKDTGYCFNIKRFPVVNKKDNHRLSIRWKLTF